jgi:hypothetical protein
MQSSKTKRSGRLAALALAGVLLPGTAAWAQDAVTESVLGRPRPGYDPLGIDLFAGPNDPGSPFILYPSVSVSGGWDDNVFRDENDRKDDFFVLVAPSLLLASDWVNHGVNVHANAGIQRNVHYDQNNFTAFDIGADGFLDIGLDSQLFAAASFGREVDGRDDVDDIGEDNDNDLVKYWFNRQTLGFSTAFGDWTWSVQGDRLGLNYIDNGEDQQDRDRVEYDVTSRLGYEFQPGVSMFVEGGYNWRIYDEAQDNFGIDRNSQGWQARAGFIYDITGVLAAEVSAGYISQNPADDDFGDTSGFAVDAGITWNPTDLITIRGYAVTTINETTLDHASTGRAIYGGLGFDYDLDDNLYFTSNAVYTTVHFTPEDGFEARDDDIVRGDAGLVWLINENFSLRGTYIHTRRYSSEDGEDYTDNTVLLTLQAGL